MNYNNWKKEWLYEGEADINKVIDSILDYFGEKGSIVIDHFVNWLDSDTLEDSIIDLIKDEGLEGEYFNDEDEEESEEK